MSIPFLITGLPRCRTAWLAAVATGENSFCHHEPIKHMQQWRDVFPLWNLGEKRFTGVSDSSMGFHLGEILDRAAPRTLIVWRPISEVEESLRRQGFLVSTNYCQVLARRLDAFRSHHLVASVDFYDLRFPETVMKCLNHLMPGIEIDEDRLDEMMETVIQVDPYETMLSAKSRSADISALLGDDVIAELSRL